MSQENVERVRAICAPWEHGDYSSAEWAHPAIEVVIADGPTPGSWRGLVGMAEAYRGFLSAWMMSAPTWRNTATSITSTCSCSPTPKGAGRQAG
jgi:hypothetical protein